MNSLLLLLVAVAAFVFGYRFYSKLLALGIFRLGNEYSTPAPPRSADAGQGASCVRHLVFGQHLASLAAAAAIAGGMVSLIWGWIPAFLWVMVATLTAAGTYGLGALWLSLRFPGLNPAEIAARVLGARAHGIYALLSFLLLLIMNAVSASLAAQLMSAFPSAVLPFWSTVVLALFLGNFLRDRENFRITPVALIAVGASLMLVWLLRDYPLAFTGAIRFGAPEHYASFDATVLWTILLFTYGYHATRLPMWKLIRPRGFITALLMAVMLFIFCAAVAIDHPNLVAPEFHAGPGIPNTLPWLFITLTSGAVAGFHLLIANGISARQLKQETDARYIGYGGALALGLLALSAIVIGGTGFASTQEWTQHYAIWENFNGLHAVLERYVDGFARMASALGLDPAFARTLAALVVLGLLAATLEAGLRVQKQILTGLNECYPSLFPGREKILIGVAAGLSALLALIAGQPRDGLMLWPLLGVADQILAVLGFTLLAVILRRMERPLAVVVLPLIFLLAATHWALAEQITQWWSEDAWFLLALGVMLIFMEIAVAVLTFRALKQSPPRPQLDTGA
ncbi:MAG: carbon starvation CstA family protein [Sulfuricaulis sp.]